MSDPNPLVYYETRFAVVLYGGISLAIYINGVAQELNRMVRATARRGGVYVHENGLTELDTLYRKLGEKLGTSFVVDILSGTSAGGLNAIYLAKSLANNQEFDGFAEVWKKTADVTTLIYDRQSIEGLPIRLKVPEHPAYLMNSQRMGYLLYEEFRKMDRQAAEDGIDASKSNFNSELDLFVTATDLYGRQLNLQTSDPDFAQKEKKFRHVFHLRYRGPRSGEAAVNDFVEANNPFLAFISRCTSAIPPAFEPMMLEDMSAFPRVQLRPEWAKFFTDTQGQAYMTRPFADGGYLDNKPFSYAAEAMRGRRADLPVDRILFYVEPSPEHLDPGDDHGPRPNLVENAFRAMGMRGAESIREDLERIRERNRLITKNARTLQKIESALLDPDREIRTISKHQFVTSDLKGSINAMGPAYGAYLTQRVDAWREGMARWIAEEKQVAPYTREQRLIARAVDAWFEARYKDSNKDKTRRPDGKPKELWNKFLFKADIDWQLRRLHFLDRKINTLLLYRRIIETAPDLGYYRESIREFEDTWVDEERGDDDDWAFSNELIDVRQASQEFWQEYAGAEAETEWDEETADIDAFLEERVEGEYFRIVRRHLGLDGEGFEKQEPDEHGHLPTLKEFCETRLREEIRMSLDKRSQDLAAEKIWRRSKSEDKSVSQKDQAHHARIFSFVEVLEEPLEEDVDHLDGPVESSPWPEFFETLRAIKPELNGIRDQYYRGIAQARMAESLAEIVIPKPSKSSDDLTRQVGAFLDDYVGSIDKTFKGLASSIRVALGNSAYQPTTFERQRPGGKLAYLYLQTFYENYEYFDKLTYSLVTAAELGEMDEIDVWRISPEDTTLLDEKTRRRKLGGQTLGHFGAFFREDWRTNDILWGRLDGAERIIRALLPGKKEQEPFILRVRAAILRDEVERRNDRLVEILRKENIRIDDYKVGPVDNGVLVNAFRRGFEIDLTLEPQSTLKLVGRSTRVAGKLMQGLEKEYDISGKGFAARLTQFGQLFIWIVEAATAGSWLHAIAGNVFTLLYFLGTLLVTVGAVAGLEDSKFDNWGWAVILATALVQYLRFAVRVIFEHREIFDLRKK